MSNNGYDLISHLQMIQGVINRMAANSFMCKGWAITIFTALAVIDNNKVFKNATMLLVITIVLLFFWMMDSHYLRIERGFRMLYEYVRKNDTSEDPYKMNYRDFDKKCLIMVMFSWSEMAVYLPLVCVCVVFISKLR